MTGQTCFSSTTPWTDLIVNKYPEIREDFMVIDHAESLIPGKFWYEKDVLLLANQSSYFKALSSFLKIESSLIQKYMLDKIVEDISKESKVKRKQRKQKLRSLKLKPRSLMLKLPGTIKKKLSTIRKLLRKRLGKVQVAISSTITNSEEEAPKVKVLLQPSLLPVRNTLMWLSKPELQW